MTIKKHEKVTEDLVRKMEHEGPQKDAVVCIIVNGTTGLISTAICGEKGTVRCAIAQVYDTNSSFKHSLEAALSISDTFIEKT